VTLSKTEITQLLERHGVSPSRALGQNFLADPNTVRRIVRLADVGPQSNVIEIGPGVGSMTVELAASGAKVLAVELDRHLLPILKETVEPLGVRVVHADARDVDWAELLGDSTWQLVANLPYNVATSLVLDLLEKAPAITSMLVMVQKEVGERLAASPGSGAWGIPSVKLALDARAEIVASIPPTVFVPKPKVDSVMIKITRVDRQLQLDRDQLMTLVRTAFSQRRKMLRRSLNGVVTADQFLASGISEQARPEQLSLDEWVALCAVVYP
jgi:16S rRNA (adenine1518-N6/adenine1519-N6)-dimethyltransferase